MQQFINKFKEKRGSEIVQTLVVIAILGTLAVLAMTNIGGSVNDSADNVTTNLESSLTDAENWGTTP